MCVHFTSHFLQFFLLFSNICIHKLSYYQQISTYITLGIRFNIYLFFIHPIVIVVSYITYCIITQVGVRRSLIKLIVKVWLFNQRDISYNVKLQTVGLISG